MAGTPFLDAFEAWAKERELEEDYIKDVYLTDNKGCIPEGYIGDDVVRDIRKKFVLPLNFIADRVKKELLDKLTHHYIYALVDADYEDSTHYALILYNLETNERSIIFYDSDKAWHYWFASRGEFEEELSSIYDEVHKCLTELGIK